MVAGGEKFAVLVLAHTGLGSIIGNQGVLDS